MDSLEEYSKDWKQIKSRQTSADEHFFNIKNQKIMNNIIKFEKEERWENKWGIGLGIGGLLFGCLFGIAFPIYWTPLSLNYLIIIGVVLMFLGAIYMIYVARISKINLNKLDESSQSYLQSVKKKLENSGKEKGWHGFIYVTSIVSGVLCVYWGIFVQIVNGESFFSYSFWMPIFFGVLGWVLWRIRYNRKEETKIKPLLKEIDDMLEGIN